MNEPVEDARIAGARGPLQRAVQLLAGVALFLYALRVIAPLPIPRGPFVVLAALLAAGAMSITDAIVGLAAAIAEKLLKGPRA